MNITEKLAWFVRSGIDECISETPINRLINTVSEIQKDTPDNTLLEQAVQMANSAKSLSDLYQIMSTFEICPLKKTATCTLTGRGVSEYPAVLCIGDVPDSMDEKQKRIFSDESGGLLDRMLKAIELNLNQNAYVTNLIPWRPPGNRKPTPTETALCLPFLKKQIDFIQPSALLVFGNLPTQALTDISSVSKARQQSLSYVSEFGSIPIFSTFHPSIVLKMPNHRKFVWEDLQKLQKYLKSKAN